MQLIIFYYCMLCVVNFILVALHLLLLLLQGIKICIHKCFRKKPFNPLPLFGRNSYTDTNLAELLTNVNNELIGKSLIMVLCACATQKYIYKFRFFSTINTFLWAQNAIYCCSCNFVVALFSFIANPILAQLEISGMSLWLENVFNAIVQQ